MQLSKCLEGTRKGNYHNIYFNINISSCVTENYLGLKSGNEPGCNIFVQSSGDRSRGVLQHSPAIVPYPCRLPQQPCQHQTRARQDRRVSQTLLQSLRGTNFSLHISLIRVGSCFLENVYRIYSCIMRTFFVLKKVRKLRCVLYTESFVLDSRPSRACKQIHKICPYTIICL